MTNKKPLHVGKSFHELQEISTMKLDSRKPSKLYISTMMKSYKMAEEAYMEGDEENAYVYYMKFMQLLNFVNKKPDFNKHKEYVTTILGGKAGMDRTYDLMERLAESLRERYKELDKTSVDDEIISDIHEDGSFNFLDEVAAVEEPVKQKTRTTVSCKEFYEIIKSLSSLLVIDCRPQQDFEGSQIKYRDMINVPEEILVKGITVTQIKQSLSKDDQSKWAFRLSKKMIILIDQNSCDFVTDSSVWVMRDCLENWDMDFNSLQTSIQLLSGGFESFQTYYPSEVTDPRYQPQKPMKKTSSFEDIQYDDSVFQSSFSAPNNILPSNNRPVINRATKAIAERTYAEKQEYFKNILEEHDKVDQKKAELQNQILKAEEDWKEVDKTGDEVEQNTVLYKIYELESKQKDVNMEDERLKELESSFIKELTKAEADKLEAQAKRREQEAKERERKQREIEAEQKRLALEREKKILEKTMSPKKVEEDEIVYNKPLPKPPTPSITKPTPKPSIPDRTNKPEYKEFYIAPKIRDFSPIGRAGRGLTGLKNLGNTCYMNSIIQCLSNTKSLQEYFSSGQYTKHRNANSRTQCLVAEEVAAVIKALWEGRGAISSKDLKAIVGRYEKNFKGYQQQDAHEFLTILMDWLHQDLQVIFSQYPEHQLTPSDKAWYQFTNQRESKILRLFYGQIKSTVECSTCHHLSSTFDSFSNLSLELPEHNRTGLRNCLDMYFNGEQVTEWTCEKCNAPRNAVKKLDISRLPAILVIHLKRFQPDIMGGFSKKQSYVEFPFSMDMRNYLARSERPNKVNTKTHYSLYAVVNHYGTMASGHYTANCKNPEQNRWYKFNDQLVSEVDYRDVNSSAAYILFYELSNENIGNR